MKKLTAPLVALIIGLGLGIGTVAVADRPDASASATNSNPDVVRELRALGRKVDDTNRKLDVVNRNLGGSTSFAPYPSLQDLLQDIERNPAP